MRSFLLTSRTSRTVLPVLTKCATRAATAPPTSGFEREATSMIENGGYIRDILQGTAGRAVTAHGWVKTRRDSKALHFVQLNDGSSFKDLQVVIEPDAVPEEVLRHVTTGACVRVAGDLVESPAAGQPVELQAREVELFGSADATSYPLQKKGHTMEFL